MSVGRAVQDEERQSRYAIAGQELPVRVAMPRTEKQADGVSRPPSESEARWAVAGVPRPPVKTVKKIAQGFLCCAVFVQYSVC